MYVIVKSLNDGLSIVWSIHTGIKRSTEVHSIYTTPHDPHDFL